MYIYAPATILHTAHSGKVMNGVYSLREKIKSLALRNDCPPYPPLAFLFRSRHLKKMTEEYPTLPQGAEASLPLTGSASCGVPSILRKMWTRHKKKSEYVGATNSAFEAD